MLVICRPHFHSFFRCSDSLAMDPPPACQVGATDPLDVVIVVPTSTSPNP